MSIEWTPTAHRSTYARPFTGEIWNASPEDQHFFQEKYEIPREFTTHHIRVEPDSSRYVLPIWSPHGACRGHVLRVPWEGAPRRIPTGYPKADTYKLMDAPLQSFYKPRGVLDFSHVDAPLVLVEDQLSAIKLAAHGYPAVAILGKPRSSLGTYSGLDRVTEIARTARGAEVIVALDADATEDAFMFVRKWRSAFNRCRVAILTADIKDTPAKQFPEVLGV